MEYSFFQRSFSIQNVENRTQNTEGKPSTNPSAFNYSQACTSEIPPLDFIFSCGSTWNLQNAAICSLYGLGWVSCVKFRLGIAFS